MAGAVVAPHVAASQMPYNQIADQVQQLKIFLDVSLSDAESAVAAGEVFKLVKSDEGFAEVRLRTITGSDLLYDEITRSALASRAHWLTVEWLPKYAPELNDIEGVWRDLKAHHLAHQTFADAHALNTAIHQAVDALNLERTPLPLVKLRISA